MALGMRLGSGTWSSAACCLQRLGARFASGDLTGVVGVPNSIHAGKAVRRLGIRPGILSQPAPLDPIVDSADEVGPQLYLVMRLGGERAPSPFELVSLEFDGHWQWLKAQGADPEGPEEYNWRCP